MDYKNLSQHSHKIKTYSIYVLILGLATYLGISIYSTFFALKGGQCREYFDAQNIENKKKICCNPDQYNSSDKLCKIKCDTLEVNPDSAFCQGILQSQGASPVAKQIEKPTPLPPQVPKCASLQMTSINNTTILKPSNPIKFNLKIVADKIKPKYVLYEFYSFINNDLKTLKAISFKEGKTLLAMSPAVQNPDGTFSDSITAIHENLFQEDINRNNETPKNILMAVSIIDENNNKYLQPAGCFARFDVDQSPNSCKSFKLDNEVVKEGEAIKFTIKPSLPKVAGYAFRFENMDNFKVVDGEKKYKFISFSRSNGENQPLTFSREFKSTDTFNLELKWEDFYREDLNFKEKYPESIKVLAYVKPLPDSNIENIEPCTLKFTLSGETGLELCEDLTISGGTTGADKSITLKTGQYITLDATSKSKSIEEFKFEFFNLDNLISNKNIISEVKNANKIYFSKSDPYAIERKTSKTNNKSILISYDDLNKIDLSTGKKPTNIQARVTFVNSDGRSSKLDKNCVATFKVE